MKTALITGVSGQTGSYLADYLLGLGYKVYGVVRHLSDATYRRIDHLLPNRDFSLVSADLHDQSSLIEAISKTEPNEIYNLAAQSFVPVSWHQPILTAEVTGMGVMRLLEAIKLVNKSIRFYQASSSEMFGKVVETPQTEKTPFYPRSPYGVSKVFGHYATVNYRESFGMFACCGICFNHESQRRGLEFVTRKITSAAAKIALGLQDRLMLGNLDAKRDWGFAGDYARAMHLMLQQDEPADYVVATGEEHSVREFAHHAFTYVGLNADDYIDVDPNLLRPAEVATLLGDASKIRALGWEPQVSFKELVEMMVKNDIAENDGSRAPGGYEQRVGSMVAHTQAEVDRCKMA